MTWLGKSKEEIRDEIMAIAKEETGINSFRDGGVMRGLIETFTQVVYPLYKDVLTFYGGQFTFLRAERDMLNLRGLELGVERHGAVKARGNFRVEMTGNAVIPKGAWAVSPTGLRFKVTEKTKVNQTTSAVPVEAEFPGLAYNLADGTDLRFTSVVAGISRLTAPANWLTVAGRDKETDADYRARIAARWNAVGDDNRPGKYELAALEIPRVNDVKVIRTPRGPGSVDIVIGSVDGIPEQAVLNAVRNRLSLEHLMTRDLRVFPAAPVDVYFHFSYRDASITQAEVAEILRQWIMRRRIGESVPMQHLYTEVFPDGLVGLEYSSPLKTVEVTDYQKVVAASVTAIAL